MESRDAAKNSADQAACAGFGHAPPGGDVRRLSLITGTSLVLVGLVGLLGWLTGLRPLTSVLPQYVPIALYAAVFFVAAGCILLWHANRAWSPAAFSIAMAASALISLTGFLGVASYFTGVDLTLESLIVPPGELWNGLPMGHISPVGGVLFALFAPAVWLGMRPSASARSRQAAALIALFIAFAGGAMTIGYLMGEPLLHGGNIIPVAALAALGFVFLGSGLAAAAGNDLAPLRFLTGDSLRAQLLRLFLPLSISLAVVQATAHAVIGANAADPAALTALWNMSFLILTGGVVSYAARAAGKDYDLAQMERQRAEEALRVKNWAIESAINAVALSDLTGNLTYVNPAFLKLWGYRSQAEVLGKPSVGFWQMGEIAAEVIKTLQSQGGWIGELAALGKDGTSFDVQVAASLVVDAAGRPACMLASFADVTERKRAQEELQKLNAELEERVIQRTTQLEATNKELEAFAYSVSHDLRAPLRGIDGWSQALWEDYGDKLDAQAQTYINRVRSQAQRMGQLIDALLQLSRLTRAEMRTELVALSAIAQAIATSLRESAPERSAEFAIEKGLTVQGDPRLLEIALSNLLANAFKFTGKTPQARIEFGQTESQGQRVFFVRDNGAGFDMAFAKKLFGAFQRMHKTSDFPGTGIGLATVARIVRRHGGRVWAEAAVDQGATFYFTI